MSLTGTWAMAMNSPMGEQKFEFILQQEGNTVTGVGRNADLENQLEDLQLKGNKLLVKQALTKPMKLTVKFDLDFDGDNVAGTAKAGMFPSMKVTGHRVA